MTHVAKPSLSHSSLHHCAVTKSPNLMGKKEGGEGGEGGGGDEKLSRTEKRHRGRGRPSKVLLPLMNELVRYDESNALFVGYCGG